MEDRALQAQARASRPEKRGNSHEWLVSAARSIDAEAAMLCVRSGKKARIVAAISKHGGLDTGIKAVAQRAFREQRCIRRSRRVGTHEADARSCAYIGLALRMHGRPAVLAFRLAVATDISDSDLLAGVVKSVLRRADDRVMASSAEGPEAEPMRAVPSAAARQAPPQIVGDDADWAPDPAEEPSARVPAPASPPEPPPVEHADPAPASPPEPPPPAKPAAAVEASRTVRPGAHRADHERSAADQAAALVDRQRRVILGLATILDRKDFAQSLHAFAEAAATAWESLRVTVAIVRSGRIRIEAVSGAVDFDRRSVLMTDIAEALEETRAAAASIVLPVREKNAIPPRRHVALAEQLKKPALLSVPLVDGDDVVGAMLLERGHEFSGEEQQQVQQMALLAAPVISLKRLEALGPIDSFRRYCRRLLAAVFGSSHPKFKLAALLAVLAVILASSVTRVFRIDADASIEADLQRAVVATFPTFLSQVEKQAGDIVRQGDVLAQLDVEELRLDRIKWAGEYDKLTKEYRATLAQRDRSNVRVLEAQRDQAQAQLDLIDAQMARATLRAPIDGVVISGDLSQAIGSTVERGQLLFEVASLNDYRLVLMVGESDIGWVELGQSGTLVLRSLPDQSFPFTVSGITPVSEPGEGVNRFRVEATLEGLPESFRPGMGGVGKIEIEPRPIGWIWTRSFVEWLRYQVWKFGF